MTTTLRLSQSILLAIGLGLCLVRRSVWLWPIVVWNMYDVAQYSLPPAHASAFEVHVIGSAGEQAVLEPTALLSMEYAGAAERLVDGAFASDLAVVNAARVSFNVSSDELTERDEGLIRFLLRERHGTPFEHGYFRFLVKAPLFVVREHHRHRAGHSSLLLRSRARGGGAVRGAVPLLGEVGAEGQGASPGCHLAAAIDVT